MEARRSSYAELPIRPGAQTERGGVWVEVVRGAVLLGFAVMLAFEAWLAWQLWIVR